MTGIASTTCSGQRPGQQSLRRQRAGPQGPTRQGTSAPELCRPLPGTGSMSRQSPEGLPERRLTSRREEVQRHPGEAAAGRSHPGTGRGILQGSKQNVFRCHAGDTLGFFSLRRLEARASTSPAPAFPNQKRVCWEGDLHWSILSLAKALR